jgi:hypothetical protein
MITETVPMWAFYAGLVVVVLFLARTLETTIKDEKTPLEWWQFLCTNGKDGKEHGDITKLGQAVGILVSSWAVIMLASKVEKLDWLGFSAIFTLYLAFVSGVAVFQAYLKSKNATPKDEAAK